MERQGDEMLTVKEVAAEMKVSERLVTKWINSGELAAIDLGKEYRIYRSDLDAFIKKRRTNKK
jgi:excisionase family DNA binding protein